MIKKDLTDYILKRLDDLKIDDNVVADTRKTSSIADYVIIGSGRSGKHIESSMEILKTNLKNNKSTNGMVSGTANDGWIILDLGNIIVHLFVPAVRDIYKLEELFNPKKIDIAEKTKNIANNKDNKLTKTEKKLSSTKKEKVIKNSIKSTTKNTINKPKKETLDIKK